MISQDSKAKQIYPTVNPNSKGIEGIGNQINACRPIYELVGWRP
jgi:hypothetical protein